MDPLPTLILKVDLFAGSDIEKTARDLCELSNRLGILVEAGFNGVRLWAYPGDDPAKLSEDYVVQLRSKSTYKIARGR